MKIHERCCQGLIASWSSQRRTVEADTNAAMARDMASRASSGHDQRDSGAPVSGKLAGQRFDLRGLQGCEGGGRPVR
ncbi:hypothetical protein [Streptomyces sp. NPDC005077]|uniref:hypothetical protein n=1 Tax=unclassified Streptomyces TaxID=2593676 RepID=UPI0033BDBB96